MGMVRAKLYIKTVLLSTLAAVIYGLIHDQITIRICPEYFTVWHPQVSDTTNLTMLALIWGVIATWWMGTFLGIVLGVFAVAGPLPLPTTRTIIWTLARILIWTAACAILAGLIAWVSHLTVPFFIMGPELSRLDEDFHRRFAIDLIVHNTSYDVGPIATIVFGILLLRDRRRYCEPAAETA